MPRELIAIAPREPVLREYDEPTLEPGQVRIRTVFASPKHGTELVAYRDAPVARRKYDRELGVMLPRPDDTARFPGPLGNMATGVVIECGEAVESLAVGDRVLGHLPIRETHVADADAIDVMPPGLSDEGAVCIDPAVMAMAVRDAKPTLGDRIAVFGLGAIGLFAVQLAKIAGAHRVVAVDPIVARREVAMSLGADHALDPSQGDGDIGLAIRKLLALDTPQARESPDRRLMAGYHDSVTQTRNLGVDIAVEASGAVGALHQAIRATRYGGTVCVLSFYAGDSTELLLGEEFHMNQINLISARAVSLPLRDAPGWDLDRLTRTTIDWLASGRLRSHGIVNPVVHFDDCAEAYREIDEHPERSIKLGIRFN
jgi:threonine dehydrogenase-like Zn-dependent dehydrogenase